MDPFIAGLLFGFLFGAATVLIGAAATDYLARSREADSEERDRRVKLIDETEQYLSDVVTWAYDRAIGKRQALEGLGPALVAKAYGQFRLELLSEDLAVEYVEVCRWFWAQRRSTIDLVQASDREDGFRTRLRAHMDMQRELARRNRPAVEMSEDQMTGVNALVAMVAKQLADELAKSRRPRVF